MINAATKDCRRSLGPRSIQIQTATGLPTACVDLNWTKKALMQLLENAVRYSPPSESITVSVAVRAKFVVISVADRGIGIDVCEGDMTFMKRYRGKNQRHLVIGREWVCRSRSRLSRLTGVVEFHESARAREYFSLSLPID